MAAAACVALAASPAAAATLEKQPQAPSTAAALPAGPQPEGAARALARLRPGQRVRVTAPGSAPLEGRLVAIRDGRLLLDAPQGGAAIDAIEKVWVRGRDTKRGALAFGALGALATGALASVVVYALGDADDVPSGAVIGATFGGALGAAAGAIIGGASPRWEAVYSAEGDAAGGGLSAAFVPAGPAAARGELIGSASLHLGLNKTSDALAASGGPGGRLSLTMERGTVNPGLELGRYGLGSRETLTIRGERIPYDERLYHVGPTVSVGPPRGRLRPYAIAGLGFYRWQAYASTPHESEAGIDESDPGITLLKDLEPSAVDQIYDAYDPVQHHDFLGGSLGGGVKVQAMKALSLGAEGRWHTNLTDGPWMSWKQPSRRLSLFTLTGGATVRW